MATFYTAKGQEKVIDYITPGGSAPAAYYVGWGVGTPAAEASTTLVNASTESRVSGTPTQPSVDILQVVAQIVADGIKTITECGLFNAAGTGSPPTGGDLIIHSSFTGIVLALGDKIEFTITHQQNNG